MIGPGPFSCLLGHVTKIVFCLFVKNKKQSWSLRNFQWKERPAILFCPPEKYKPAKWTFCCRNFVRSGELKRTVEFWNTVRTQTFFKRRESQNFAERKIARFWVTRSIHVWKVWMITIAQKFKVCLSQSRWTTVHLLKLPNQSQHYTSLCRPQGKNIW